MVAVMRPFTFHPGPRLLAGQGLHEALPDLLPDGPCLFVTDAGVRASITDRMFAEYKIEYRYDATPAEDFGESDLRHLIGVGWKF